MLPRDKWMKLTLRGALHTHVTFCTKTHMTMTNWTTHLTWRLWKIFKSDGTSSILTNASIHYSKDTKINSGGTSPYTTDASTYHLFYSYKWYIEEGETVADDIWSLRYVHMYYWLTISHTTDEYNIYYTTDVIGLDRTWYHRLDLFQSTSWCLM